jgi:hypothetical protein
MNRVKYRLRRTISSALAIAVVLSLPGLASAKSRHHWHHFGVAPIGAVQPCYPAPACLSPYAVFSAGTYVGSDPDPRIRAQMLYDFNRGVYATPGR